MKRLILFFILLSFSAFPQDALFRSSQQSLVYTNPSFAGRNGLVRSQSAYRMEKGFSTGISSIDAYIKPLRAGVAVTAFSDNMNNGTLRNSCISVTYAQYFVVGEKLNGTKARLIPSIQFGMGTLSLDRTRLNFGDVINPRNGERWDNPSAIPSWQKQYFNWSAGLLYSGYGEYIGISVNNINQPDVGLSHSQKLPLRTSVYLSGHLMDEMRFINISFLGNFQPGSFNMMFKWTQPVHKYFVLGAGYSGTGKNSDYTQGIVASCGLRYKLFTLMYGYDQFYIMNSDYKPLHGAHELSLSISVRSSNYKNSLQNFFGGFMETW